jgi:hypothetical protein
MATRADMPDMPNTPATPPATTAPQPAKRYTGLAVTSWILIILTCLLSIIPVIGFATWLLAIIVVPLTLVFAIIILTRGGKGQGIVLIIASVILMPGFLLIAPVVSTLVLGASISAQESAQEKQIIANLNKIASAKAQWAEKSSEAPGTAVTMAELKTYLDGKEVKVVVGEIYDPKPVGEAPAAKLPADKSLAGHKKGEEITAESASPKPAASAEESASPSPTAEDE